jgi:hypothetical protein
LNLRLAYWRFGDMDIIFKERGSLFFGCLQTLRRLECRIAIEKCIVCQTFNKYFHLVAPAGVNSEPRLLILAPWGSTYGKGRVGTVYSIQSASNWLILNTSNQ